MTDEKIYSGDEFWKSYAEFVDESIRTHRDAIMNLTNGHRYYHRILDLGCGRTREVSRILRFEKYLGVDSCQHAEDVRILDYRTDEDALIDLVDQFKPTIVTSLFSTEITAPFQANEELYEKLFRARNLECMIVAGFYYSDKRDMEKVVEAPGTEAYQSIHDLTRSDFFKETRLSIRNPSKMFGPNVVEVWRKLEARDRYGYS